MTVLPINKSLFIKMRALHLPDRHQRRMDQAMFHKLKSPTEMRGLFPIMGLSRVFYTVVCSVSRY